MIEIAFDENLDNTYKNEVYPVIDVPNLKGSDFKDYLLFAEKIIQKYSSSTYLIIQENEDLYNLNKVAFAFFVASCINETDFICLVCKVQNRKTAYEHYKPYIALSIGLKYALRLALEPIDVIYRELRCLNYLSFSVKENYANQTIVYRLQDEEKLATIMAETPVDAIVEVSVLKALSLAEIRKNIELIVPICKQNKEEISPTDIINRFLKKSFLYFKN